MRVAEDHRTRGAPPRVPALTARCAAVLAPAKLRRELLGESQQHPAWKLLCPIPSMGPIRAAVPLIGIRTDTTSLPHWQQLWTFSSFGIETHSSGDYRCVEGLATKDEQAGVRSRAQHQS